MSTNLKEVLHVLAGHEPGHLPNGECCRCIMYPDWGDEDGVHDTLHEGCPVTRQIDGVTKVCKCECRPCKRAWFDAGRPMTNRDGVVSYYRS